MQHNTETLIDDLLSSIPETPNVEKMEAAERALEKSARPPWTEDEPFDCEAVIAKGEAGEICPIDFSKLSRGPLMSHETSTDEVARVAGDALRRLAAGDDILKREDDVEPPEDNPRDDEPPEEEEIPADDQVKADMAFLKSEQARGRDIYDDVINPELRKDYQRGKQLAKAAAYLPNAA